MRILIIIFILNLAIIPLFSQSTVYYVSNSGNDNNDGTSVDKAWATLLKVNQIADSLKPGDQVLFNRGDIFEGEISVAVYGTKEKPIQFGAFGTGEKPVISGSVVLRGWEFYQNNIFRIYFPEKPIKNLFVNGRQMTIARYPNSGFLKIGKANENRGFYCSALNQPIQYWKNAKIVLRTVPWAWENRIVKSFIAGNLIFDRPTDYPPVSDWGFYLYDHIAALDSVSEWFYDIDSGYLYFRPPGDINPEEMLTEGLVYDTGISLRGQYLMINDIHFKNYSNCGIRITNHNNSVENSSISNISYSAVEINGKNSVVSHCRIEDINGIGINAVSSDYSTINHCTLNRIGLHPEMSETGQHHQIGINSRASNLHIHHNIIDSTGYSAIQVYGDSCLVERNCMSNTLLRLDDGGALYSYGNSAKYNIFRNNFIENVIGYGLGTADGKAHIFQGIYLDNGVNNTLVKQNTITNTSCGLQGNAATHNNVFDGNVSFGNHPTQLGLYDWIPSDRITGYVLKNNELVSTDKNGVVMEFAYGDFSKMVDTFSSNLYADFQNMNIVFPGSRNFNAWRSSFEPDAKIYNYQPKPGENPLPELITNKTDEQKTILLKGNYIDLMGNLIQQLVLEPFTSKVLVNLGNVSVSSQIFKDKESSLPVLYPNPVKAGASVYIQMISCENLTITLFDVYGRKLFQTYSDGRNHFILPASLSTGLYTVLISDNSFTGSYRLMVTD